MCKIVGKRTFLECKIVGKRTKCQKSIVFAALTIVVYAI